MPHVAQAYVAGTPEAEVIGQAVSAFVDNMEAETISPILPKHGFDNINPDKWYPHQSWLNVLHDMEAEVGGQASMAFVAFGKQVVQSAVMPDTLKTIPDVLNALHDIHHLNLRNVPDEEGYSLEKRGDTDYIVFHNTPNPDHVIYGFLWGLAARFKSPSEQFVVRILPENPRPDICRSAFEVKWGDGSDL